MRRQHQTFHPGLAIGISVAIAWLVLRKHVAMVVLDLQPHQSYPFQLDRLQAAT